MQELAILLRKLKSGGHKALIFTQMARMLDVLEVRSSKTLRCPRLLLDRLQQPSGRTIYHVLAGCSHHTPGTELCKGSVTS